MTRLITDAGDVQTYTLRRETDVRTAITRGLKEYLEQQAIVMNGGRPTKFVKVLESWSEPEQTAKYPSALVYAVDAGTYDSDSLSTQLEPIETNAGTRYVQLCCEFVLPVVVECWTTDPLERAAIVAMLEDAFNPVDWMYGFRLELPHYHNARLTIEPTAMTYLDSSDDAGRRYRRATFALSANCPLIRMPRPDGVLPEIEVRIQLEVGDSPDPEFNPDLPVFEGPGLDAGGRFALQGQRAARGGVVARVGTAPDLASGGQVTQTGAGQPEPPKVP